MVCVCSCLFLERFLDLPSQFLANETVNCVRVESADPCLRAWRREALSNGNGLLHHSFHFGADWCRWLSNLSMSSCQGRIHSCRLSMPLHVVFLLYMLETKLPLCVRVPVLVRVEVGRQPQVSSSMVSTFSFVGSFGFWQVISVLR